MKKLFAIAVLAVGFMAVLSSCGNSRHNCPAYGSVDNDNSDYLIACIEQK